ncbi:hypothetical protein NMY22_g8675 [Coprinellus aureogranulatus]|nr:hypothetical protein NMY22_g8675 [Coprinellus aureogranulatus]
MRNAESLPSYPSRRLSYPSEYAAPLPPRGPTVNGLVKGGLTIGLVPVVLLVPLVPPPEIPAPDKRLSSAAALALNPVPLPPPIPLNPLPIPVFVPSIPVLVPSPPNAPNVEVDDDPKEVDEDNPNATGSHPRWITWLCKNCAEALPEVRAEERDGGRCDV